MFRPPLLRSRTAHPRSRGEHKVSPQAQASWHGSSPLARGTPMSRVRRGVHEGLIPARAGNTAGSHRGRPTDWAHPRSRGEHADIAFMREKAAGSSPLARGTPAGIRKDPPTYGLIPARAGNTGMFILASFASTAHPRSRGEHPIVTPESNSARGSSPLARGTRNPFVIFSDGWGLIPARAGNTSPGPWQHLLNGAHPRSRGEHRPPPKPGSLLRGSSPLARGTRHCKRTLSVKHGLIPARAGNTVWRALPGSWHGAHPRSRGEHNRRRGSERGDWGSSPLARGTLEGVALGGDFFGLIPARAGNTARLGAGRLLCWAHPRSRGEHTDGGKN